MPKKRFDVARKKMSRWGFNEDTFLVIGGVLSAVGFLAMVHAMSTSVPGSNIPGYFYPNISELGTAIVMVLIGMVLMLACFVGAFGRTCPKCRTKMTKVDEIGHQGRGTMTFVYQCPACGYHRKHSIPYF